MSRIDLSGIARLPLLTINTKNLLFLIMKLNDKILAIIGLGYVGLPLAVEFGKARKVIGFDINPDRIAELQEGNDRTLECKLDELAKAKNLRFSSNDEDLKDAQIYIVTVPTPVNDANRPDTRALKKASSSVGKFLKKGDVVIYESTVYPGATEEICVPVLEKRSGLKFNVDFFCGYSPERINPGDKKNTLTTIKKITSGSTPEVAQAIDELYGEIITAGTHKASSIKVAEAAKVIENTQRDLNIALMNELSLICHRIDIDTEEVLQAAGTKWNFLPFRPGLVGGHCIGVDPFYLTHKAEQVGYYPEVILAGRRVNDSVARHVADQTIKLMLKKDIFVLKSRILVLGLTFKENCPDIRNSKVLDLINYLKSYHVGVDIYDPWIDKQEALEEYGHAALEDMPKEGTYDAIILAVAHRQFKDLGPEVIKSFGKKNSVLYDVKSIFPKVVVDGRL